MANNINRQGKARYRKINKNIEWYLALFALITIVIAFYAGKMKQLENQMQNIQTVIDENKYRVISSESKIHKIADKETKDTYYIAIGEANGYAGKIKIIAQYNSNGTIQDVEILEATETHSYLEKVLDKQHLNKFTNKSAKMLLQDITVDAVSGATKTSQEIHEAVKNSAAVFWESKGNELPGAETRANLKVGAKEIIIALLFILGIMARTKDFRFKKQLKWFTLLAGLIFLGFVYNPPLSITRINSFLIGFWPEWKDEFHIYLLLFGTFLILITTGKNVYCTSCPFGATQKLLGTLGKAKNAYAGNRIVWKWIQRSLAWAAIILALLYRNPSSSGYEVYSALFQLTGSTWMFALLAVMIVISVFWYRPWCNHLCPMKPVFAFILLLSNKTKRLIRR